MVRTSCFAAVVLASLVTGTIANDAPKKEKSTTASDPQKKQSGPSSAQPASASETRREAKEELRLWPYEKKLIELTNAQRRRYGLSPLSIDKSLLNSARTHCYWMAGARSLTHTTAAVAENIAMGQTSCDSAVADWMTSPGHRANMLGSYGRIGAAAYQASDGTIYWCLQFLP
jgi:uncharacterized protein YkwD